MGILDLFSKRQKKLRGEVPDVYVYDNLPPPLRVQIIHIWRETIGNELFSPSVNQAYTALVKCLRKEYGVFRLPGIDDYNEPHPQKEFTMFFLNENDTERALDAVELSFRVIDCRTRDFNYLGRYDASERADAAIEELNQRFKEHGVGYEYSNGQIVRIDSALIHAEVVKPALRLLNQQEYAGAQQEFLKAHEHYRLGNAKEALNDCLKAFESVMKSICSKRKWTCSHKHPTAKDLIKTCMDQGLIPSYWESHYTSLRSLLESGVPTGRNRLSGHGQGSAPQDVPGYIVSYMLHMTASAIVFLAEAEAAMP